MTTEGQQLATAASSDDPAIGLRGVRALRELAERLEAGHVAKAREKGWSWQDIADCIGVSRQAVHQKYGRSDRQAGPGKGNAALRILGKGR
jgi:hypothetical protein